MKTDATLKTGAMPGVPPAPAGSRAAAWLRARGLSAPLIVGGTGGSGTRLFVQLLRGVGVQMGGGCNDSEDALPFVDLYTRFVAGALAGQVDRQAVDDALAEALQGHCAALPPGVPWGWKNPRSVYLWPVFESLLPGVRLLLVVRDGLTMAGSRNQNQLAQYGGAVLGHQASGLPPAARSLWLWARVNAAAADFGATLGERFLWVRFEDAVADPAGMQDRLAGFLGLSGGCAGALPTIAPVRGRCDSLNDFAVPVAADAASVLDRFGYSIC